MKTTALTLTTAPASARLLPLAQALGLVTVAALATALAAQVRLPLPFTPVPITLQTAVVLLAGGLLGWRLGAVAQGLYLGLAALGLPLLAGPALLGPTGGYLAGFVLAAMLMGFACERLGAHGPLVGVVAGTLAIYACGSLWLSLLTGQSLLSALSLGVLPFLAGDALKAAGVVAILRLARRWSWPTR